MPRTLRAHETVDGHDKLLTTTNKVYWTRGHPGEGKTHIVGEGLLWVVLSTPVVQGLTVERTSPPGGSVQ